MRKAGSKITAKRSSPCSDVVVEEEWQLRTRSGEGEECESIFNPYHEPSKPSM